MTSLHPSHLTHSPSGTLLRGRSGRIGFGVLVLRNQAMERWTARRPPGDGRPWGSGLALRLFGFQIVGDAETHTGGVVHLARGLLGVLELGQAVLHLGQLLLDRAIEILHLLPGGGVDVFVELPLILVEAHASSGTSNRAAGTDAPCGGGNPGRPGGRISRFPTTDKFRQSGAVIIAAAGRGSPATGASGPPELGPCPGHPSGPSPARARAAGPGPRTCGGAPSPVWRAPP